MGLTIRYEGPDRVAAQALQSRISEEMPAPTVAAFDIDETLRLWTGDGPPDAGCHVWYYSANDALFSLALSRARELRRQHGLFAVAVRGAESTAAVGEMHFILDSEGAPITFQNLNEFHGYLAQWCAERQAVDVQ